MMKTLLSALFLLVSLPAIAGEFALGPNAQEQKLFSWVFSPDSTFVNGSYSTSECLRLFGSTATQVDDEVACSNDSFGAFTLARDVVLTRFAAVRRTALSAADTSFDKGGCDLILATSDGSSQISASEIEDPASDGTVAVGTISSASFQQRIAAGTMVNILKKDGSHCGDGASCVCSGEYGDSTLSVYGVIQ